MTMEEAERVDRDTLQRQLPKGITTDDLIYIGRGWDGPRVVALWRYRGTGRTVRCALEGGAEVVVL